MDRKIFILILPILFPIQSCMNMVVGCAGIQTYERCAKFCTHDAVATCEANYDRQISNALDGMSESNNRAIDNMNKTLYGD